MPINDYSTFDKPRLFFSSCHVPEKATTPYNFITFLARVQKLQIPFLPITWQPKRPLLGEGGTSQISQALINLQTSFAFKRVADKDKFGKPEGDIFRCLVNEITVLWQPTVRNHPNILELQGICWDIPPKNENGTEATPPHPLHNDKVWPVLVFEKSYFGDLYHFARLPIGRELGISDRLKICLEIGNAIAHMQSNCIIHGDIKPHNVVIFKSNDGSFTAKVTDFGFSTCYTHDDGHIVVPESWPWYAPECHEYLEFSPQQAVKTDVFSFGMLCLWFIFEKHLSGVLPFPEAAQSASASHTYKDVDLSLGFLEDLKKKGSLAQFANQLVIAEAGSDAETRQMLQHFFSGCLACDPEARDVDIQHSMIHMSMYQIQPTSRTAVAEIYSPADHDFNLNYSLDSFYSSDYRLRSYIFKCLEEIVMDHSASPLSTQLALCYELGFGCPENDKQLKPLAYNREETQIQLEKAMNSEPDIIEHAGTLYNILEDMGHHSPILLADHYREHSVLETAESITRKDIESIQRALGVETRITLHLKVILSSIVEHQGQWKEAEKLQMEVMDTSMRLLGQEHLDTLKSMTDLASTFQYQNRWKEAESLQVKVLDTSKRSLGQEHPDTLSSMIDLASTFWDQSRWQEAEKLLIESVDIHKRVLGHEHPNTLNAMMDLASIVRDQAQWQDAEKLHMEIINTRKRVFGQEHLDTLSSMGNLVSIYRNQNRWQEAEKLQMEIMNTNKRVFGHEHSNTLTTMSDLALMYESQGQWEMGEKLELEVVNTKKRILGQEHPHTLISMADLAWTFKGHGQSQEAEKLLMEIMNISEKSLGHEHTSTLISMQDLANMFQSQNRWQEAEKLWVEVVNIEKRTKSQEHPDTLSSMECLAQIYQNQEQWKKAEDLNVQVMETRMRVLGQEHPDVLISIHNLAFTWKGQGMQKEALALMEDCSQRRNQILGPNHPSTLSSLAALNEWKLEE